MKKIFYPLFIIVLSCILLCNQTLLAQETLPDLTSGYEARAASVTTTIRVIKPSNRATDVSVNPTIKTQRVQGALTYTVELSELPGFNGPVLSLAGNDSTFTFENLKYLTKYYARAKTDITPTFGSVTSFTTRSPEIYTFVLFPYNGLGNVKAPDLSITSNFVPGAKRYTIELSNYIDLVSDYGEYFIETSQADFQRTLTFHNLSFGTTYYARVTTDVSPNPGRITTFTTRVQPFSAISIPENGSIGKDFSYLEITASPVAGTGLYTVELNTKSNFSGTSIVRTSLIGSQNSFIFKNLAPATTYFTRVKSDVYNTYGPTRKFTTRATIKQHRLWGVTSGPYYPGTIFSYSIDSAKFTAHYYYHPRWSDYLGGSLVRSGDGGFYVLSGTGGDDDSGNIFKLNANGEVTHLNNFSGVGNIMQGSSGYLYQTEAFMTGTIFRADPSQPLRLEERLISFDDSLMGVHPRASLTEASDGYLYGTTSEGGLYNGGTIFKIRQDGQDFQKIFDFNTASGTSPEGKLLAGSDGYIYGSTVNGGAFDFGTVFRMKPDGNNYQVLHHFASGADGANVRGELIQINNTLYGMSSSGGDFTFGTIFRIQTDGTNYAKLHQFSWEEGVYPSGGLVTDGHNLLYGMTQALNDTIRGGFFSIKTDGTNFNVLGSLEDRAEGTLLLIEDDWFKSMSPVARSQTNSEVAEESGTQEKYFIYPNPFNQTLSIEAKSTQEEVVTVYVIDVQGKILNQSQGFTNQQIQIENNLASGMYIVKIIKGNEVSIHRVVKK